MKNGGYSDKLTAKVGTAEFDEQWKDLAKNDPAFAQAQHDYIKRTHYDRAASNLAMNGIDLSERGKAVQDMLWSTSVQFGAGDSMSGGTGLIRKALAGRDASNMSDAEIIEAVQNYKLANNDRLFASSSEGVRKGTARRAALEKERLLKLNGFENGAQNPAAKQVAQSAGLVAPEKERSESDPEKAQADAQAKMLFAGTLDKTKTEAANLDPLHRSFFKDQRAHPKTSDRPLRIPKRLPNVTRKGALRRWRFSTVNAVPPQKPRSARRKVSLKPMRDARANGRRRTTLRQVDRAS